MIVTCESKEFTDFSQIARDGPVCNTFELLWVHLYPTVTNNNTQVVDFFLFEVALFRFKVEVVLFQFVKHVVGIKSVTFQVLLFCFVIFAFRVDGDVIHVYG